MCIRDRYVIEDRNYYEKNVKFAYEQSIDKSNARWIRNFNEKLLKVFATRVIESESTDLSTLTNEDIDQVFNCLLYTSQGQSSCLLLFQRQVIEFAHRRLQLLHCDDVHICLSFFQCRCLPFEIFWYRLFLLSLIHICQAYQIKNQKMYLHLLCLLYIFYFLN